MSHDRVRSTSVWSRGVRVVMAAAVAVILMGARTALPAPTGTYTNPIIAQNVADPAIIKALDGYYYLSGSSDFWSDGSYHFLPIFRSPDLVHWT